MKIKLFALAMTAALCASAAIKDPNEKNPFSDYDLGMQPAVGDPMAVEWQDVNDAAIAAATTEDELAACVADESAARALLSKLRGAYASTPLALTKIAAVSQWVMSPEPCCLCFWKPSPAAGRKVWVKALLDKAAQEGDGYIKTFCLDQLRWCAPACPCVLGRIRKIADGTDDKGVKDFAAFVIREIQGSAGKFVPSTKLTSSWCCFAFDEKAAAAAAKAGFTGVEVFAPKGGLDEKTARAWRAIADKYGLRIHSVTAGGWYLFDQADKYASEMARARREIACAAILGADTLLIVPAGRVSGTVAMPPMKVGAWKATFDPKTLVMTGCAADGTAYPEYVKAQNAATVVAQKAIRELLPLAEEKKVVLAVENVGNLLWMDPKFMGAFLRSFNSPYVKWFADPTNSYLFDDPIRWIDAMPDLIAKFHLKDMRLSAIDYEYGADLRNFGEGDFDLLALRKALDRAGYSGWITIEGIKKLTPDEAIVRLDRFAKGEPVAPGVVNNVLPGRWALDMPCGWVGIRELLDGSLEIKLLWNGGSPIKFDHVEVTKEGRVKAYTDMTPPDQILVMKPSWHYYRYAEMYVEDGQLKGWFMMTDGEGKMLVEKTEFTGSRLPDLPPAPDMSALKFGEPIDLLKDGLDAWDTIGKTDGRRFGWEVTPEGTFKNTIRYNKDGVAQERGINIVTKRHDFEDFKIAYDVKVPPKGNSGVYLRGIYEVQTCDSYGKPVDSHYMAALYSRITPRVSAEKPANEWQHVEATLCDRHVTIFLNGVNIIDNQPILGITGGSITTDETKPGPIYLQGDHTCAEYRNMILTPIVK